MFKNMFEKAINLTRIVFLERLDYYSSFWTNLRPILAELIVKHIIRPKIAKLGFLNLRPILSS